MMLSVADIEQKLRDQVQGLALQLLPNAKRDGNYLKVGSIQGEPGGSLVIHLQGSNQGLWQDYAGTDRGDMLDLIEITQGLADKGAAVAWAKDFLGLADEWTGPARQLSAAEKAARAEEARARMAARQAEEAKEREAKIRGAKALYLHRLAVPIAGTPVEAYLRGRGLLPGSGEWPGVLRFHPEVYNKQVQVKVPAMLAAIYLADGTHVATHRTFLQESGGRWGKLDVEKPKRVLGPMWGGFAPINKGSSRKSMRHMPAGEPVYVTEGIENALVVRMKKPEARIVCAISLGNIGGMVLPAAARRLIICADRDLKPAAQDALERSIAAQQARGLQVELVMPPVGFNDLNDWLLGKVMQRRSA